MIPAETSAAFATRHFIAARASYLFAYVESLAGFEERFHARKHARPAPGNFACHGRIGLEVAVSYRQAHHVFNRLDLKRDARFVGEIIRVGPAQHEAFGREACQETNQADAVRSRPKIARSASPARIELPGSPSNPHFQPQRALTSNSSSIQLRTKCS